MRHNAMFNGVITLVLASVMLVSACVPSLPFLPSGPEAAARKGYEQWIKNTATTERSATFEVLSTTERSATVKITAEFQNTLDASWQENQATVQVLKQGNDWQPPTSFAFFPSPRAVKTQEAIRNVTATVETARRQATFSVQATAQSATAEARATTIVVETQQARNTQATRAAEATQQAFARQTTVAQRTTPINKPMSIQSVERDSSAFRDYYRNVEFVVVGIERGDGNSVLWHFSLWNHNTQDTFRLSSYRETYTVSSEGKKYDALRWEEMRAVAGEKKEWAIAFNAPATTGTTYRLFMSTYIQTDKGIYAQITWQPFEVTLR
ncbi:MAG: hypothetical protein HY868_08670 [Chloroflexi bacterium]|nr:hypothetical protein [Chloroflexota bacterium]